MCALLDKASTEPVDRRSHALVAMGGEEGLTEPSQCNGVGWLGKSTVVVREEKYQRGGSYE